MLWMFAGVGGEADGCREVGWGEGSSAITAELLLNYLNNGITVLSYQTPQASYSVWLPSPDGLPHSVGASVTVFAHR